MNIDESTIEKIVERVIQKLEDSTVQNNNDSKPTFLIVNNSNTNCEVTRQLKKRVNVIENENEEIPKIIEKVLFLDATQDLFVKGALGITDTKEAYLLSKAIKLGLSINIVPSESFEWIIDISNKKETSPYEKMFNQYMDSLNKFGVKTIDYQTLLKLDFIESYTENKNPNFINEKLLTKEIVKNINSDKLNISKSTVVTPLARDAARELKKEIYINGVKEEQM